jgi:hypothetical protein
MSHNINDRALVPDSMMACRMSPEQEDAVRYWVNKLARDESDRRYLLAVWVGDPLD